MKDIELLERVPITIVCDALNAIFLMLIGFISLRYYAGRKMRLFYILVIIAFVIDILCMIFSLVVVSDSQLSNLTFLIALKV